MIDILRTNKQLLFKPKCLASQVGFGLVNSPQNMGVKCQLKLDMHSQKLKRIGTLLPPYYEIADFLWGADADIDSDGNSENPESLDWNELTLVLRSNPEHRIDIDPDPNDEDLLIVKSEIEELLLNTVVFLKSKNVVA